MVDFGFWSVVANLSFWTRFGILHSNGLYLIRYYYGPSGRFWIVTLMTNSSFWTQVAAFTFWTLVADFGIWTLVVHFGYWTLMADLSFWTQMAG